MALQMSQADKILIKNMVCQRCIITVEHILRDAGIPFRNVMMGEVELGRKLSKEEIERLKTGLNNVGFELIETRLTKIIEDIKLAVLDYLSIPVETQSKNLSAFITDRIPNDYSYLSDLFSSVEGRTIEKFLISQRIERVKELLLYNQLSLTQIAYRTGYSSVHHLSAQFKKVTGFTPSHFKTLGGERRKGLDQA